MSCSQALSRWAACVEYDGSAYHGWQAQDDVVSVQTTVEAALAKIANHPVRVVCCGRTDTGVHATGQVIHFDSDAPRRAHEWVFGANRFMPDDVSLRWAQQVTDDFHARFGAQIRDYRYLILNHPARSALYARRAACYRYPLDVDAMAQAAGWLIGEHDFSAFRAAGCQAKSPIRTMHFAKVTRLGDFVAIDVRANAFLQHMVRNITGSLLAVGRGERPPEWIAELLTGQDRRRAGAAAPAHGLYFLGPGYPDKFKLPQRPDPMLLMPADEHSF